MNDLLNRFAAWTGYLMFLLFIASAAFMLAAFASGHPGWGIVAAGAMAVALTFGSAVVGGVTRHDRHIHHEVPHLF